MARLLFGYTPSDFAVAEDSGNDDALIASAVTLEIYDEPSGDRQSDLLDSAGSAATEITAAAGETVIFYGPDDWDKDLYGTPDSGVTWYRFPPSSDALVDRVAALEAAGPPIDELDDLGDVSVGAATNGQVLTYVSATQTWTAATPPIDELDDLGDVSVAAATNGQVLTYVSATQTWTPATPSAPAVSIDDLDDVDTSGAVDGSILVYDSGDWVIGENQDANLDYGVHVVTWNGSAWRYRGTTVTERPSNVATYANGGYVMWDTTQDETVTTPPTLAVAGDKWMYHPDVTPTSA